MRITVNLPAKGQTVTLWENQKQIKVKVYKANINHVTVIMPDKKMWCMTLGDFNKKLTNEWS